MKLSFSVPSNFITSVRLSVDPDIGVWGEPVTLICTTNLSSNGSGAMIEFDYGFTNNLATVDDNLTQENKAVRSPVNIFSTGEYTCTVTVTAPGVCGGSGSEPACPTNTSDPVTLKVQCK